MRIKIYTNCAFCFSVIYIDVTVATLRTWRGTGDVFISGSHHSGATLGYRVGSIFLLRVSEFLRCADFHNRGSTQLATSRWWLFCQPHREIFFPKSGSRGSIRGPASFQGESVRTRFQKSVIAYNNFLPNRCQEMGLVDFEKNFFIWLLFWIV